MCGRFALSKSPEEVRAVMGYDERPNFPPRHNIAPTQPVGVVHDAHAGRSFTLMRWGFVPAWAKNTRDMPTLINARAESAADKPAFRNAMRHRRCLIPADAFYEWQAAGKDRKVPHLIRRTDRDLFAFGGLWETYADPEGGEIDTVAILTTSANGELRSLHQRMPVVIDPADFDRWLDTAHLEPRHVAGLLAPAPEGVFEAFPVSSRVNSVANDDAAIQEPLAGEQEPPLAERPAREKADSGQMDLF